MSETQPEEPTAPVVDPNPQPYRESEEHVPDMTAMSGTLETSGTGGGRHAHITGVSRVFGDVERFLQNAETLVRTKADEVVEGLKSLAHGAEAEAQVQQMPTQQTSEEGGLPTVQGAVVQGDGTGHPEPVQEPLVPASAAAQGPVVASPTAADGASAQTATGAQEASVEGASDADRVAQAKANAEARLAADEEAAQKAASTRGNGRAAKKTAASDPGAAKK
jgi:hypothetical protein